MYSDLAADWAQNRSSAAHPAPLHAAVGERKRLMPRFPEPAELIVTSGATSRGSAARSTPVIARAASSPTWRLRPEGPVELRVTVSREMMRIVDDWPPLDIIGGRVGVGCRGVFTVGR